MNKTEMNTHIMTLLEEKENRTTGEIWRWCETGLCFKDSDYTGPVVKYIINDNEEMLVEDIEEQVEIWWKTTEGQKYMDLLTPQQKEEANIN